ncbi:MAG: hypothetical protein JWQ63_2887 [Mucilaginibacter sp.]|nr:hypothetical protein [Mucilaginibacter sp.]
MIIKLVRFKLYNEVMKKEVIISHQQILLSSSYEDFTKNLEAIVRSLKPNFAENIISDPESVRKYLEPLAGDSGLIIFGIEHHGDMLNIYDKRRKAKQYIIGNPLIAIQMEVHDIRAALYAPLRMIAYESNEGEVYAEYDLPSSLFGQFNNNEVLKVAKGLDEKLLNVIKRADQNE